MTDSEISPLIQMCLTKTTRVKQGKIK